jgi:hypothetical protein
MSASVFNWGSWSHKCNLTAEDTDDPVTMAILSVSPVPVIRLGEGPTFFA